MRIVPYLNFQKSLEALDLYEKLGATNIQITRANNEMFTDMPEEMRPSDPENFVMNASFEFFNQPIYCSDTWDGREVDYSAYSIAFDFNLSDDQEVQDVRDFFDKMEKMGGKVEMPLSPAEWTPLFGMIRDPFGITWIFNGV